MYIIDFFNKSDYVVIDCPVTYTSLVSPSCCDKINRALVSEWLMLLTSDYRSNTNITVVSSHPVLEPKVLRFSDTYT